jgi:uncharacterized iron-regulated protein
VQPVPNAEAPRCNPQRIRRRALGLAMLLAVSACSSVAPSLVAPTAMGATTDMANSGATDAGGRPIDIAAAADRVRGARYVLLGEIHDNPAHHRLRADLLRALLADGRPTWVVFEQIDRQYNAAVQAAARNTDAVIAAGQLDQSGWAWPLHRPLFDAALAAGATVVGGNLGRAEASGVMRAGAAQLPADLLPLLAAPWSAQQNAEVLRQVDEGHCGALPASMLPSMALAQRARDAALAHAMAAAPAGTRVVLIAGNGHVRRDVAVPHYLLIKDLARANSADTDRIASIGLLERAADGTAAADAPYDETWFTSRSARPDPCAGLREMMDKKQGAANRLQ